MNVNFVKHRKYINQRVETTLYINQGVKIILYIKPAKKLIFLYLVVNWELYILVDIIVSNSFHYTPIELYCDL